MFSAVTPSNVALVLPPISAITSAMSGLQLRTARASAIVTRGRRIARSHSASLVMMPSRSMRNVPTPTSLTMASDT